MTRVSQPLLLLAIMASLCLSKITIWSPQYLKEKYQHKNLHYSIATFGKVPYGHSIMGRLVSAHNDLGCKPIQSLRAYLKDGPVILVTRRGSCNFSLKARNAQAAGASAVLVLDHTMDNVEEMLPTTHDPVDFNLSIPTLIVQEKDFSDLLGKEDRLVDEDRKENYPVVSIDFEIVSTTSLTYRTRGPTLRSATCSIFRIEGASSPLPSFTSTIRISRRESPFTPSTTSSTLTATSYLQGTPTPVW